MKNNSVIRHGDMIIVKVSKKEVEGKRSIEKSESLTVGIGEVSGHSHLIRPLSKNGKKPSIFEYANDKEELTKEDVFTERDETFFEIRGGKAVITHEEHGPITLDEGVYKRWFQVTYNPFEKTLQKVRD